MERKTKEGDVKKQYITRTSEKIEEDDRKKMEGENAGHRTMSVDKGKADSIVDRMKNRVVTREGTKEEGNREGIDNEHTQFTPPDLDKELEKIQIEEGKLGEVVDKEVEKIAPLVAAAGRVAVTVAENVVADKITDEVEKDGETVPEDTPKHWNEQSVNSYIKHIGIDKVRQAL